MGIIERRAREKKERRRQIMDAAKELFSTRGFQETTMEEIANKVELSPSTLYLYFQNKEELYGSMSVRDVAILLERLEKIDSRVEEDAVQRIKALKEVLYSLYEYDPQLLLRVFNFQTSDLFKNLSPELKSDIQVFSRKALHNIARIFESGIRQKSFVEMNPICIADFIWSVFSGMVIWEECKTSLDPQKRKMRETLDLAFEIIIKGVQRTDTEG